MLSRSLLLLLAHFGATVLTTGPVTVTFNQHYIHFLSLAPSVSHTSMILLIIDLLRKISQFYSVTKSAAYSPLVIIFQVSSRLQDDKHMVHCSQLNVDSLTLWPEDPLFKDSELSPPTKIFLSSKQLKHPCPGFFIASQLGMTVSWWKTTLPSFCYRLWKSFLPIRGFISSVDSLAVHNMGDKVVPLSWINMVPPKGRSTSFFTFPFSTASLNNLIQL